MSGEREALERDYEELDGQLRRQRAGIGLAEADGMACGMVITGADARQAPAWAPLVGDDAASELAGILDRLFDIARRTLGDTGFAYAPVLPGPSSRANVRVEAIAEWCSGFLQAFERAEVTGLGTAAHEALDDIRTLTGITADDRDDEAQARDLLQIEEYLRVAVQLLYEDRSPATPEPPDTGNRPNHT